MNGIPKLSPEDRLSLSVQQLLNKKKVGRPTKKNYEAMSNTNEMSTNIAPSSAIKNTPPPSVTKKLSKTLSLVDPVKAQSNKKRSLRSNTVITAPADKKQTPKKREKKIQSKVMQVKDDDECGAPPTKGKDFSYLLKNKYKKSKSKKSKKGGGNKVTAPVEAHVEIAEDD